MVDSHQISEIKFEEDKMIILLDDRELKVNLKEVSPKLLLASDVERALYKISPSGYGIHWPLIDEDLSIKGFILKENDPNK
ncbi:DUF2442 domain-containing protein [Algoriphagus sanaruensis]|uniref:DUF2442 domain-containing protein n=1 Tax=Algoriphagus sanaruensis TaxID=1727163 RepID=A0A142ESK2_9BACT|nr:DUF2442 domain-containing protein [Algoriphagus sanaruensis]AMQ58107.1 hypothetical protein AO498_16785 [Algoriphagus sanaruensis]